MNSDQTQSPEAAVPPMSQATIIGLPAPQTWNDYEKGCVATFHGGYRTEHDIAIFQHGMGTVFNLLRSEFPPAEEIAALRHRLAAAEQRATDAVAQSDRLRVENEALKGQVAAWERDYKGESDMNDLNEQALEKWRTDAETWKLKFETLHDIILKIGENAAKSAAMAPATPEVASEATVRAFAVAMPTIESAVQVEREGCASAAVDLYEQFKLSHTDNECKVGYGDGYLDACDIVEQRIRARGSAEPATLGSGAESVKAEREACAVVVDKMACASRHWDRTETVRDAILHEVAAAIRARGSAEPATDPHAVDLSDAGSAIMEQVLDPASPVGKSTEPSRAAAQRPAPVAPPTPEAIAEREVSASGFTLNVLGVEVATGGPACMSVMAIRAAFAAALRAYRPPAFDVEALVAEMKARSCGVSNLGPLHGVGWNHAYVDAIALVEQHANRGAPGEGNGGRQT